MSAVLVLNAGYEPLHRVSVPHAARMLVRGVAVVEEAVEGETLGPYPLPRVLRLVRYVAMRWLHRRRRVFSRPSVLERDGHRCAYCGGHASTVDHVLPRSRGGTTDWLNLVAACAPCNSSKDDRTPEEAGMPLLWRPHAPAA